VSYDLQIAKAELKDKIEREVEAMTAQSFVQTLLSVSLDFFAYGSREINC